MTWPNVDTALATALVNDSDISAAVSSRIYYQQGPSGAALPYLIFYQLSRLLPHNTAHKNLDYLYSIESRSATPGTAVGGADHLHQAVFDALDGQALTISGWTSYWVVCQQEHKFIDTDTDGKQTIRYVWDVRVKASETDS